MSESRKKGGMGRASLKMYGGLLISIACIAWVIYSVESDEVFAQVKGVDKGLLAAAVFATALSYLLRAVRWRYFFDTNPPKYLDSFRCLIIGFFMNNVLPARIGEFVRAHLGRATTSHSRSTVLATIAGERLADGLAISALFALLFTFGSHRGEDSAASGIYYVAILFALAAVGTVVVLIRREALLRLLERFGRIMPGHLSGYTLVRIERFIEGLEPMLRPRRAVVITLISAIIWLDELLVYKFVSDAFSVQLSLAELSLFLAAVNFSSLIPAAPGGIGVIEAFATAALVRVGVQPETALAMVAAQHIIQIGVVGVPGAFFFFLRMGGKLPEQESEETPEDAPGQLFVDVSEPRPERNAELDASFSLRNSHMAEPSVDISIIIPAFNEESRLPKTLLSVRDYFEARGGSYEVLVVDDGSRDDTSKVVRQFEKLTTNIRLLSYPENHGKGYAVRLGMLSARGRRLLFNDADGSTPIAEIERLERALDAGAHIAIGSRAMFSKDTHIETVWYRKVLGRTFNAFVNMLILPGIADTQCGFKLFVREAAELLFARQRADRFSFDVELLFLARRAGFSIAEVPINWTNVPGSKVNLIRDSLLMFRDILKFRLCDLFGGYGQFDQADVLRRQRESANPGCV